ncbi:leucine-rich repeat domain-containing protein [Mucilaginibacter sabulilitoris]|uniref:Leucine-rich repeat domain-containing protein n=1 Tax=Mucilaginibacter sabulilitoris TaxID=1173583 RepID=A0ABZ0TPY0_9SPHI|nr:leucine-rich repeat domain-containing protein [Mucilaginibacter sabulilitoris]WPU94836.1 leucine-rich repeat domain-containing protein [Mucilaginibacter sabulilitoris]
MKELEVFKTNLKIDDVFYDLQLNDKGHIIGICLYDCDYIEFEFNGDLLQALSPFIHLKNLDVEVSNYTITDLSGLSNFKYLERLTLDDCCKVDDISALAGLKQLTHLAIINAEISDITVLGQLTNLVDICLSGSKIASIDVLKGHQQLVTVNFSFNQINDVSPLLYCKKIRALSVDHNQINDLSVVAGFDQIEQLSFNNNNVSNLNFLSSIALLKHLSFNHNPVTDITPLSCLPNLQNLFMQGVSVTDLEPVKYASKLVYLSAGPVKNFEGKIISRLVELSFLHLQHCNIRNVSFLKSLKKLTNLNLDHNQITGIDELYACKGLNYIYLRDNNIREPFIADLFPKLMSVDLRENDFGNKIFVSYYYSQQENQELLTVLNKKVADYYLTLGENDKALAFFYINDISKKTLKIRFEQLLATNPKDVFYLKYYIICCVNCLANLLNKERELVVDDAEIKTIFKQLKEIITQTSFIDKADILESLSNHKQYYKYILHEEYIKYFISGELGSKKGHPEIIFILGKRILRRETISEVLYIYKTLVTKGSPFQYPLYKELSKYRNNINENIAESNFPAFDLVDYYRRNYSHNVVPIHSGRSYNHINSTDYTWKMPYILKLIAITFLLFNILLKACN